MINIFLRGLIYGVFSIIPGLSGGAIAIKLGDYDKCINIIYNKDFNLRNFIYLLVIICGFMLGTTIFSRIILNLYLSFKCIFKIIIFIFNILIIKGLIKKIKVNNKMLIKIILSTLIIFTFFKNINISYNFNKYVLYLVCGLIFSFSKIVPGLSATSLFINLNFYDDLLKLFSNPFITIIKSPICWSLFIITVLFSGYLLIKTIYKCNDKFNYLIIIILIFNTIDLII